MKFRKGILTAFVCLIFCLQANCEPREDITQYMRYPYSVLPYDGGIFVSNFGSLFMEPRRRENKGYILYYKNKKIERSIRPAFKLHKPTAMVVYKGKMFVCDTNRVVVFNMLNFNSEPDIIEFGADDNRINDIAIKGNTLYATVTDSDRVYAIDAKTLKTSFYTNIPSPNCIVIKDNEMFVSSVPKDFLNPTYDNVIYHIKNIQKPKPLKLITKAGLYDGLALSEDKRFLYFSDWESHSVKSIDLRTKKIVNVYSDNFMAPGDISYYNGYLYIPDLSNNRVIKIHQN